jgi:hypothetical protein
LKKLEALEDKVTEVKRKSEKRLGQDGKAYTRDEFTQVVPQSCSGDPGFWIDWLID